MPVVAIAAVAAGAIVGGAAIAGSGGSVINEARAQDIQKKAQEDALEEGQTGFDFQAAELAPFVQAGKDSLATLTGEIDELTRPFTNDDFVKDPGFEFRLAEGQKAIDNTLSRIGLTESGAAVKAATRFSQNFASNEFQNAFNRFQTTQTNRFNRLASLVDTGQQATNRLVGAKGQQTANAQNIITNTGRAVAGHQSTIGDIENAARARRGEAIAGAAKGVSEAIASGVGGGAGGAIGGVS
jgi:hypothetical protein